MKKLIWKILRPKAKVQKAEAINRIELVGDPHRFGKRVSPLMVENELFLNKPRSVKLEFLLLDSRSPLSSIFQSFTKPIGNIEVIDDWSGLSKFIPGIESTKLDEVFNCPNYLFSAGQLISIATLLGLTDLHRNNVKICGTINRSFLLPLDLEIYGWDCVAGLDTLLIPSRLISLERCGLSAQTRKTFATNSSEFILDGFLSECEKINSCVGDILASLDKEMSNIPIRVLTRSTQAYQEAIVAGTYDEGVFTKEEVVQMKNGDIPYFFTFRNEKRSRMYYFSHQERYE